MKTNTCNIGTTGNHEAVCAIVYYDTTVATVYSCWNDKIIKQLMHFGIHHISVLTRNLGKFRSH